MRGTPSPFRAVSAERELDPARVPCLNNLDEAPPAADSRTAGERGSVGILVQADIYHLSVGARVVWNQRDVSVASQTTRQRTAICPYV